MGIATLEVPAASPRIVESKSMKLYLGSFAQTRFDAAGRRRRRDRARPRGGDGRAGAAWCSSRPAQLAASALRELDGVDLDTLDVACTAYDVDAGLLAAGAGHVAETLRTDLFRSMCPVTASPTSARCASRTRARRSTAPRCCATSCRTGAMPASTSIAWSGSSWT